MFRRRRRTAEDPEPVADEPGAEASEQDVADDPDSGPGPDEDEPPPPGISERPDGPWDASEIDLGDGVERLDLGALLLVGRDGMELQVQVDEASGQVSAVTMVLGDGAVQIQPFAAPRTTGIWAEVRREIRASINAQGGLVDEVDGPFGPELRTRVQAEAPDGSIVMQPARFVGVDGPRWFLRGVFLGDAAVADRAEPIEQAFREVVIVRGDQAMAPGDPLTVRLPVDLDDEASEPGAPGRPPLDPFERGPEITEIR